MEIKLGRRTRELGIRAKLVLKTRGGRGTKIGRYIGKRRLTGNNIGL
jgi:hypothetical protein